MGLSAGVRHWTVRWYPVVSQRAVGKLRRKPWGENCAVMQYTDSYSKASCQGQDFRVGFLVLPSAFHEQEGVCSRTKWPITALGNRLTASI